MANGLFILSAPSGSGKSTLVQLLLQRVPQLRFSISYTTRKPRGHEQSGREYFFVTRAEFDRMAAAGELLEHAEVFGNGYGTAWKFLRDAFAAGDDILLDIDVQGARQVRQRFARQSDVLTEAAWAISIFVAPPDRETLAQRLHQRGLDRPEAIETRLRDASVEIAAYNDYDYILINDRLSETADRLEAIVRWERVRHAREGGVPAGGAVARWRGLADSCLRSHAAEALRPVLGSFGVHAESS